MSARSAAKRKIEPLLEHHRRPAQVVDVMDAPQVTRVLLRPRKRRLVRDEDGERSGQLTKVSHLRRLSEDIALGLGVPNVQFRVDARGLWMEVPKKEVGAVYLDNVWSERHERDMVIPLGVATDGSVVELDLQDPNSCHVIIGGSSGSGKTVLLRTILTSMLSKKGVEWDLLPEVIIIDVKHDLGDFRGNMQLHFEPVTTPLEAVTTLEYVLRLTRRRHEERDGPYAELVVVIDEYADLVYQSDYVEDLVKAIVRIGRSAGVHLILATQRPSRDVITGGVKANVPCRIALAVPSVYDSRTIINEVGAEKLRGKGDALLSYEGQTRRFQVAM